MKEREKQKQINMNKNQTQKRIQQMVAILKGDLVKLEHLLKYEEDSSYRERVGTKIIKYSEEKLSEIYNLAENI
jgi:hypothetical protein